MEIQTIEKVKKNLCVFYLNKKKKLRMMVIFPFMEILVRLTATQTFPVDY